MLGCGVKAQAQLDVLKKASIFREVLASGIMASQASVGASAASPSQ